MPIFPGLSLRKSVIIFVVLFGYGNDARFVPGSRLSVFTFYLFNVTVALTGTGFVTVTKIPKNDNTKRAR